MKKEIKKWINYYRNELSLQEWKINLIIIDCELSSTPAHIEFVSQYRKADLTIFLDGIKAFKIKNVIKHELLHLFHADLDLLLKDILEHISPEDGIVYWNQSRHLTEKLVTKMERLIK